MEKRAGTSRENRVEISRFSNAYPALFQPNSVTHPAVISQVWSSENRALRKRVSAGLKTSWKRRFENEDEQRSDRLDYCVSIREPVA
jgi:hypothetical protein